MKRESRTAVYDGALRVEAYRLEGIAQPFPNHFHEYYVIGLLEDGERVRLEQLCRRAGLSKSTLLRAFTRAKGVTPYGYLENIRVGKAGELLAQGVSPLEAALRTGFSDQSHFTNYWGRLIGLTPGAYREIFKHTEDSEHGPAK